MSTSTPIRRFRIGPVVIDGISKRELVRKFSMAITQRTGISGTYVNANVFEYLHREPSDAPLWNCSDVVFCDGVGAKIAFRLLGATIEERMTPPDFVDELLVTCASLGEQAFLVGDEDAVVGATGRLMNDRWNGIVCGVHNGFFVGSEVDKVADVIVHSGARLVLVGMGTPRQERFIRMLRTRTKGCAILAVGGLFRWYSKVEQRGPRWMTDHGLEWLTRLLTQRSRVARRYLVGLPAFGLRILAYRLRGIRCVEVPRN